MSGGEEEQDDALRSEATLCLVRLAAGDQDARGRLFEMLYEELRDQASSYLNRENPGHTLQSTALVHEAWLKMIQQDKAALTSKGHFMAVAAQTMRRIMIDHARTRTRQKRGGAAKRVDLEEALVSPADEQACEDLLAVDQALEALKRKSERMARIVELRFFAGLSREEVAEALDISESTVKREWRAARALMSRLMDGDGTAS